MAKVGEASAMIGFVTTSKLTVRPWFIFLWTTEKGSCCRQGLQDARAEFGCRRASGGGEAGESANGVHGGPADSLD